jgi:hypothetical membrane protein
MASREAERLAGLMLFASAAQFMTVIMLGASIAPAYDYAGGAISDLGAIGETALLFNLSLVAVGVLNVAAGSLLYRYGSHRRSLLAIFALAGIGAIGAGLVPLGTSGLHGVFAIVAFLAFNLEAVGTGVVLRGPMRVVSVLAGIVGFVFVGLMIVGDAGNAAAFGPIGHGGTERMIVYPVMIWMLAFGGWLMGVAETDGDPISGSRLER